MHVQDQFNAVLTRELAKAVLFRNQLGSKILQFWAWIGHRPPDMPEPLVGSI